MLDRVSEVGCRTPRINNIKEFQGDYVMAFK
jgi:hypothetical protein